MENSANFPMMKAIQTDENSLLNSTTVLEKLGQRFQSDSHQLAHAPGGHSPFKFRLFISSLSLRANSHGYYLSL